MGRTPGVQLRSVPWALVRGAVAPGGSVWVLRLPGVPGGLLPVGPCPGLSEAWPCTCSCLAGRASCRLPWRPRQARGTWGGQGRAVPACVGGRGRHREYQGWGSSETPGLQGGWLALPFASGEGTAQRQSPWSRCWWAVAFSAGSGRLLGCDDAVPICQVKEGKIFDDVSSGFSELASKVGQPHLTCGLSWKRLHVPRHPEL